ncbi:late secretory pathway protein AVL9 homolog [Saccoglossus kowalevskii]|uniref:Late secretory pathway protein AVL9 homolog n=1 Tax=Saccoglossus kowalevskii TaxID=10224 RepID=A0ABM0MQ35_SACKO|nr:PREDICTED: late secretory pathway protein AVL9 homolog [Saccoglossus kowalevskii]
MAEKCDRIDPVLHVVVVGFHHKKGCQVDYSYPPLIEGCNTDSQQVPEEWKYLPFLALPDGAHHFTEDTVYFHLPDKQNKNVTVYGVSYFRQIESKNLLNRTSDVTRGTVLKSVCILSKLPLYGLFQAKLQLITYAYFKERDFSKTGILKELFENLNLSISSSLTNEPSQIYLGLSVRDLIMHFKHKILVLFKLLLLERRVLIFGSPVKNLCSIILSMVSLFPGMIESGLSESVSYGHGRKLSTNLKLQDFGINTEEYLDVQFSHLPNYSHKPNKVSPNNQEKEVLIETSSNEKITAVNNDLASSAKPADNQSRVDKEMQSPLTMQLNENHFALHSETKTGVQNNLIESNPVNNKIHSKYDNVQSLPNEKIDKFTHNIKVNEQERTEEDDLLDLIDQELADGNDSKTNEQVLQVMDDTDEEEDFTIIHSPSMPLFKTDDCGFPLALFTKGSVCYPYIALQQHEVLQDINVRSFLIGATNCLFKQKKHLLDVVIDIITLEENNRIVIQDNELRKQLNLSTADLRFADILVRNVLDEKENVFLDPTGWEGGEEWLRLQFKLYLQALLATVQFSENEDDNHDFNHSFINAWKTTHNYRVWKSMNHSGITEEHCKHPCHGNLSVADMKLRLKSTEQGRKLSNAVTKTGTAVMHTGRMVGGAFNTAKSTVSSWFSGLMEERKSETGSESESEESS